MPLTLEAIHNRTATVGVIGLGYVGLPLALAFAEANMRTIGFDIDAAKIQLLQAGQSYIKHINHGRLQRAATFQTTSDFSLASECDALLICVPTPLDHHLGPDISYIQQTVRTIAPHVQPQTLISLESTSWPGTTDEVVLPLLQEHSRLKLGQNLYLCYSPEREDPGNSSFNTKTIPKLVGASDPASLTLAAALYGIAIESIVPVSSMRVAETAKLFENIFRSVNIALVNELKMICDPMGIDPWEVIQAASSKPFGFMPFWPGPGLGGHCIPVDPFYLSWKAKEFGLHTRFIELAGEINRAMPKYVLSKIQDCLNSFSKSLKGSKVLLLGMAYKADVDDMRESPSLELMKLLQQKNAHVDYHDPLIPEIGKTREYSSLQGKQSTPLSSQYDCFVLATAHSCFDREALLAYQVPIVDTRNLFPRSQQVFPA
jgi:UDP-N-acetyl-D-glucosamine dehydrogenase